MQLITTASGTKKVIVSTIHIGLNWPNKSGTTFIKLPEHHAAAGCAKANRTIVGNTRKRLDV